jgi:ABC-type uncharacterized transport system ATPase subunit
MDAIASGVQARFEERTGYSKKVTDETVQIARSLGVASAEIEKWAALRLNRLSLEREKAQEINSILHKAYRGNTV